MKKKPRLPTAGPKWICSSCGFKYNAVQRVRCRQCAKRKNGNEETWQLFTKDKIHG